MDAKDLEKLRKILDKKDKREHTSSDEDAFANDLINKLLDLKKSFRKEFKVITGDELRKQDIKLPNAKRTGSSFEAPLPKSRGSEGGYDSKADVSERESVTPDSKDYAESPTRKVPNQQTPYVDKKEEKLPKEDSDGKPYGDKTEEEWADADEKPHEQVNYEEDRVGRYTEHANYDNSIKVKDIVVKSDSRHKKVGIVAKTYATRENGTAVLVKWYDGTFSHENVDNLQVLKATGQKSDKAKKEEEQKVSPPIVEAQKVDKGFLGGGALASIGEIAAGDLIAEGIVHGARAVTSAFKKPKKPKVGDTQLNTTTGNVEKQNPDKPVDSESVSTSQQELPTEPPGTWMSECIKAIKEQNPDFNDAEASEVCHEGWKAYIEGDTAEPDQQVTSTDNTTSNTNSTAKQAAGKDDKEEWGTRDSFKPVDEFRTTTKDKVDKGDKPPSDWLDNCVAALKREGSNVDDPYAVCTASYQKMKSKGLLEGNILKISVDDMKEICPACAEKMVSKRIKFYKFTL